jgi:hypothetical protein
MIISDISNDIDEEIPKQDLNMRFQSYTLIVLVLHI